MKHVKTGGALLLSGLMALSAAGAALADTPDDYAVQESHSSQPTSKELRQLLAPIALYPDALIGQILAASAYPAQIVQASRWMQEHSNLKGESLAQEVNKQPWDPSVRALTQFPEVLGNLDKNLSWTSALGDAYVNSPQTVLDMVQTLRREARKAGNLKDNDQERVTTQGQTIIIQPANPQVVYVPTYDPWLVYGGPILEYPGWYPYGGLYINRPGISFGIGFGVGFFAGFGWGWNHWGADWHHNTVIYNHNTYINHSNTFIQRNNYYRGNTYNRVNTTFNHYGGSPVGGGTSYHSYTPPHFTNSGQSGAFGGYHSGGVTQNYSLRGRASSGFSGGFHSSGSGSSVGGGFHSGGSAGGGFHSGGSAGGGFHGSVGGGGGSRGGGGGRR